MPQALAIQRAPGRSKLIPAEKVAELTNKGLTQTEVARVLKVSPKTVYNYLSKLDTTSKQFKHFKENKADVLAGLQAVAHEKRMMVLESLREDDVTGLDARQKASCARDLAVIAGIDHDHEKLERGQSTSKETSVSITIYASDGSKQAIQVNALTPAEQVKTLEYNEIAQKESDNTHYVNSQDEPSQAPKRRRGRPRKGGG